MQMFHSHIWLCNCSILNILILWGKFGFLFHQCGVLNDGFASAYPPASLSPGRPWPRSSWPCPPGASHLRPCRLSWLTNSALVYKPKCGGEGSCGSSVQILSEFITVMSLSGGYRYQSENLNLWIGFPGSLKGSDQWETRGVGKVADESYLSRTVVIEVLFSLFIWNNSISFSAHSSRIISHRHVD
jgi:hypothetical protein